jgi:RNA polymerase sigma factor (sigma-70 family)
MDSYRPAYFGRLLIFLRNKGRSREDAEDLIQEALLRLHVYARGVTVENREAFLRRAVRNLAIDQYRHNRNGRSQEMPIEDVERENPLVAAAPAPDQVLDIQQQLDDLATLLDAVSPRTREIYFAHRAGYNYTDIANDMGIAKMTIRRHIARAHLAIVKRVDAEFPQHGSESQKSPLHKAPRAGTAR